MLLNNYGRIINYVRLSVTDVCNLRCQYCMPAQGIDFAKSHHLLTWEEMKVLVKVLTSMGITKIRLTGGEPLIRKGIDDFLAFLSSIKTLENISITTNATHIHDYIDFFKTIRLQDINISIDSTDRQRFLEITRRDQFNQVIENIYLLTKEGFQLKLNCVVMEGKNTQDIIPLIELAAHLKTSVRFIEEMPFNGTGLETPPGWRWQKILEHVVYHYGSVEKTSTTPNATAQEYIIKSKGYRFGIIPAFSRTFCGTCNRLRISATGQLRTCLYGKEKVNFKELLGYKPSEENIRQALLKAIHTRARDGFEAEKENQLKHSMSILGG